MKPSIHHWRYENGETCPNPTLPAGQGRLDPLPRGWYCWVYPYSNDGTMKEFDEFEKWLEVNCPSADYARRFNSGDPMITVHIKSAEDAAVFRLTWPF